MVVDSTGLHYPNLQSCGVVLSGTPSASSGSSSATACGGSGSSGGASTGPVSMPREVLDSLVPLPPPYPFEVGERFDRIPEHKRIVVACGIVGFQWCEQSGWLGQGVCAKRRHKNTCKTYAFRGTIVAGLEAEQADEE